MLASSILGRVAWLVSILVLGASSASPATAASLSVQAACASDYFAYCSKHDPDSPGVRACMRANGARLSRRCVTALIAAGEVSKAEVQRRTASK